MEILPHLVTLIPLPFVPALQTLCESAVDIPVPAKPLVGTLAWLRLGGCGWRHSFLQPTPWHDSKAHCSDHVHEQGALEGSQRFHQLSPSAKPLWRRGEHLDHVVNVVGKSQRIEPKA